MLVEVLPIAELLLRISGVGGPELHLDADKSSTTVPDQYVESSGAVSVAVEYRQLAAEGEWSASVRCDSAWFRLRKIRPWIVVVALGAAPGEERDDELGLPRVVCASC